MAASEGNECPYNFRKRKSPTSDSIPMILGQGPAPKIRLIEIIRNSVQTPATLSRIKQAIKAGDGKTLRKSIESRMSLEKCQMVRLLSSAVQTESLACVKVLLEYGASPDHGHPLLDAAERGNVSIITELLKFGADIGEKDSTNSCNVYHKLVQAALDGRLGDIEPVFQLLQHCNGHVDQINSPDDKGCSSLVYVLRQEPQNTSLIRLLMKYGAKPTLPTLLVIRRGSLSSVAPKYQFHTENTLLHYAANYSLCSEDSGNCDALIETLISVCGFDIEALNYNGMTPFLYAVYNNNLTAMKTLSRLGADIHAVCDWNIGAFAIWLKYHPCQVSTALWMLQQGLDVNKPIADGIPVVSKFLNNNRLLEYSFDNPDVQELLTQMISKASLASLNYPSLTTPLFWFTLKNAKFVLKLLLEHGANVEQEKGIYSPIAIAAEYEYIDILQLLLSKLQTNISSYTWLCAIRKSICSQRSHSLQIMVAVHLDRKVLNCEYVTAFKKKPDPSPIYALVETILSDPDSLQNSCRRCLWAAFPPAKPRSGLISQLAVPQKLKDFLLFIVL